MRCICTSIVAMLVLAGTSFAATINVPGDYPTIQGAIDVADDGDEILVGPGIYTSDSDNVVNTLGKNLWLHSSHGPQQTIIDGEGLRRGILCDSGESSQMVIEGFVIQNGYSVIGQDGDGGAGGGMACWNSNPTLKNCVFRNNVADWGGGLHNDGNEISLTDCTFEGNVSNCNGGGLHNPYASNGGSAQLVRCSFISNTAACSGGGLFFQDAAPSTLSDCKFIGNTANEGAGLHFASTSVTITGSEFSGNSANGHGGGISSWGSTLAIISDCTISGNTTSDDGGGIYCSSSSPTITDCRIADNTATSDGGGIFCGGNSQPAIADCVITRNAATWRGGGIWCYQDPAITGCVISNNSGAQGGGIYGGTPVLTNTTVCGNDPDQVDSDWTDNGGNEILEVCPPGPCCTNDGCVISEEDDCVTFLGNWLGTGSSCDDCDPPLGPRGACCVNGICVEISEAECWDVQGSYAGDDVTCEDSGCPDFCLGDIDGNGVVTVDDLLTVIANWGPCP